MTISVGLDLGTGAVKTVLFRVEDGKTEWLARRNDKIRQRNPFKLAEDAFDSVLKDAGLAPGDVHYTATTGDGESIQFSTGHFYSMTTHARGAIYLEPETRSLLDVGGTLGIVSNVTLYGDTRKGRRPFFGNAALPEVAEPLLAELVAAAKAEGVEVITGRFGADMDVELINTGPVTLWLDTAEWS